MLSYEPTPEQLDRAPWMRVAMAELGVAEVAGEGSNPRVLAYLASCDRGSRPWLARDETPWCSAFANWTLLQCGMQRTHSLAARSWCSYGGSSGLRFGAIVVLWRGVKLPPNIKNAPGHVGFVWDWGELTVTLLAGNQGDRVSKMAFPRSRVIAVRYPTEGQIMAARLLRVEA